MDRSAFLPEVIEELVGESGKEKVREAGEPSLALGGGDGLAGEIGRDAFAAIAGDEDLFDGEDAIDEAVASVGLSGLDGAEELGIGESLRSGAHGCDT
jgi:hypothetical protein